MLVLLRQAIKLLPILLAAGNVAGQWTGDVPAAPQEVPAPAYTASGGSLMPSPMDGVGAERSIEIRISDDSEHNLSQMVSLVLPAQTIRRIANQVGVPEGDPSFLHIRIIDERTKPFPVTTMVAGEALNGSGVQRQMRYRISNMTGQTEGISHSQSGNRLMVVASPVEGREFAFTAEVRAAPVFGKEAQSGTYVAMMEVSVE